MSQSKAAPRHDGDTIGLTTPFDLEKQVVGAGLTLPADFKASRDTGLKPDAFSNAALGQIWQAMIVLDSDGAPVEEETVARRLDQEGNLGKVGGREFLGVLAAAVDISGRAGHYAAEVIAAHRLRRVHELGDKLRKVRNVNGDATGIHEELQRLLTETAGASLTGAKAVALAEIERERIDWLWPGRVPLGMLTLLIGDPGLGKSLLTIDLAAKTTRAGADVLLLSAEDHAGATIRPRAEAAGADLSRLHIVTMRRYGMEEGLALPDDAFELDRLIEKHSAKLVVVDPLMAHLPESVNSWRDQSMRQALAPLHRSAEAHRCAILVVAHLNKAAGVSPLYRAGGSIGIPAAVRSALLLARDPEDEDTDRGSGRVLAHVKCNVGPQAESLAASIETVRLDDESEAARFKVTGTSGISAADLLAAPATEQRTKRDDAADFLREELSDGPRPTKELQGAARAAGIGWRTIEDAKSDLKIEASKSSFAGGWIWTLPDSPEDRTDEDRTPHISNPAVFAQTASESGIEDRGHPEDRKTAEIGSGSAELGEAA